MFRLAHNIANGYAQLANPQHCLRLVLLNMPVSHTRQWPCCSDKLPALTGYLL